MSDPVPPRATFRPHERIKDPADFRRAFDRKRAVSDAAMVVHAVENGRDHARLGIAVARKKVRRATARNRLKRLFREAFRRGKSEIPTGLDYVVVPRDPALTFEQASRSLVRLARDAARRLGSAPRPRP
jgi:ribonuclease P protein component